ncbi:MAG: 50S ribosomal protein L25 [Candidatus Zixiibacteriota bacterium]
MKTHEMEVQLRTKTKKGANRRLREKGYCSAVLYGPKIDSLKLAMNIHDFKHILHHSRAGENSLLQLKLEEESEYNDLVALIREVQYHPVTDDVMHVDLLHIHEGYETTFPVGLEFEGEPVGVRFGGILTPMLFELDVTANPVDTPDHIKIDVSELDIGDAIHAGDLELGDLQLEITDQTPIVTVVPPKMIEIEEEEEEEEEGLEGEAAEGEGAEGEAGEGEKAEEKENKE